MVLALSISYELPSLFATRKGERCTKGSVHPVRHPRVHLGDGVSIRRRRGCARQNAEVGRGQDTLLGWSDPTFAHGSVPKVSRGSLQPSQRLPSVRAVRISAKRVKKVGITYFSIVFTIFFSL
jgi:hypothetical protein